MKSRWKLRDPYFRGRGGIYEIKLQSSGETLKLDVDDLGYFYWIEKPDISLGIFAQPMPAS